MNKYFTTAIGQLRLIAFFEGISLLVLVFLAVPLKYLFAEPSLVKTLGPIHGTLFLLFVLGTIIVSIQQKWKFSAVTWKVLLACIIPFGTFYVDAKILSKMQNKA